MSGRKSPSRRTNDLHHFQKQSTTPANRLVRKMAELVLHERPDRPSVWRVIGEKHGAKRKFSEEEVRALRTRWKSGESIASLARENSVHSNVMGYLLNGITYAWVR